MIVSSTQAESDRQPLERQGARPRPNAPPPTHRKPLRLAVPALLALLAALAAAPAAAQTVTTLVSNIGQTTSSTVFGNSDLAQPFTTGSNANGYTLSSIDIVSADTAGKEFALSLYTTNASGHPDTLVATLTVPGSFAAGTLTFTAPASTTLAASTVYAVRVTPGSNDVTYGGLSSNAEDSGAAAGWSIGNGYFFPSGASWSESSTSLRFAIKGAAKTGTTDTTAPAFESAAADGASLVITFNEDLAAAASLANSAFTVKKTASGGSEATVALSTTVAPVISGKTVTLTLGTALVSTDGSVKVTYTKPTTGSANKLVDAASNETATFTDQPVTNNTPAVVPNNAPVFNPSAVSRSFVENTAPGQNVGDPVTATDADTGDTLGYTLGGADAASFDIVETSGQIQTKTGVTYDHEAKASYAVTVAASDGTDSADATVTISVTDVNEPPAAPDAPAVAGISGSTTSLTVSWTAPPNDGKPTIATYDVQYRQDTSGTFTDGPQDATGTSETITGLMASTLYQVQVRATNAEGDSAWSASGSGTTGTTATAPVAPAAPTVAAVTGSSTSLAVSWIAPADGGSAITTYDVQYRPGTSGNFEIWSARVTGTSFTLTGLAANSPYQVQVRATNAIGDSGWSASGSGTTNADTFPPALVAAVVYLSGAVIELQLSENLQVSNLPPASAFTVTAGGSAVSVTAVGIHADHSDTALLTVSPVIRMDQVVVVAYADPTAGDDANAFQDALGHDTPDFTTGSGGVPAVRNPSTVTATAPAAPTAPTVAAVSGSSTSLAVSWSAPADNGSAITSYDLQYQQDGSTDWTNGPQNATGTSATIMSLTADTLYQVQVRATNAEGDSDWSPSGSGTTNAVQTATAPAAPTAPTVAGVSGSTTSLAVSWSAPADNGSAITSYDLQYQQDGSTDWTNGPQDVNGTSATITGLTANTLYQVQVRATNAEGDSGWSASGSGTTNAATIDTDLVVIGFRGVSAPEGVVGQLSFPEDVGTAVFTAYLDRSLETALSVPWFTSDDTAVSPDDYTGGPGTLTFAPGEIEQTISIPIVDDAIREDPDPVFGEDELFLVALKFGDDYRLKNSGLVMVLVLDNDGDGPVTPASPGVTVSPSALTVAEGTTVTYTVRLGSEPTGTVTVTPSSDNPDVTFSPATLTFTTSNWATAQTVTVTAAQDSDTAEDQATISHAVAGEDYGSVTAPSVPVTVPDDDVDPDPDPDDATDGVGDEGGGNDTANNFPTADAGPDQTGVREGALVSLDGSGSSHPDDEPLRYRWNQLSGEPVLLSSQNIVNPTFTAPQGLTTDAVLSFSLLVTDPDGRFDRDTVTITVEQGTSPSVTGGPTYYFPHLAVGEGWQTTITYINYSTQEVNCQTDFLSDQGTPLMVSFEGRGTVVSRTDVLPPGGSVHQETNVGLSAPLAPGWARGTCSGPVKASLLYRRYNSEGMPIAEAGVNATTVPATRYVTFAEQGEGKQGTGVAYANPSATAALVTFTARDAEGLVLDSFDRTLLPGGHAAQNMAPLFDLPSFTGSLEVTSTEPIVSLSLNFEADPVFSSLPPGELDAAAQGTTTYYFPHLAVGAVWQTTITYINYSSQEVTCQTEFHSDQGSPLMVSFADRGTVVSRPDVLPPGGSVHQETNLELSAPLAPGWARATCSGPLKASLLYRRRNSEGVPTGEAGVNAITVPATRFVTFAEQGEGKSGTGVAYANPSDSAALITFTARDADGETLASVDRTLLPNGHDAQNMAPLFGLSSFAGSLEVTSTEPIVSLSLNFEADPVFSSLPPGELDESAQ